MRLRLVAQGERAGVAHARAASAPRDERGEPAEQRDDAEQSAVDAGEE